MLRWSDRQRGDGRAAEKRHFQLDLRDCAGASPGLRLEEEKKSEWQNVHVLCVIENDSNNDEIDGLRT